MKVKVKTVEQLKATPGIRLEDGDFIGPMDTFTSPMIGLFAGKEIEVDYYPTKTKKAKSGRDSWIICYWMLVDPKEDGFTNLYERLK